MKKEHFILFKFCIIFQVLKEVLSYNESVKFNFSYTPKFCYFKDFEVNNDYRPFVNDRMPVRGCSSDERNKLYQGENLKGYKITNVTFEPKLDYFFNKDTYPPQNRDPLSSITFRIVNVGEHFTKLKNTTIYEQILFSRSEDYRPMAEYSKKTGQKIKYSNSYILPARIKIVPAHFDLEELFTYDPSYSDYEFTNDTDGFDYSVKFDGYRLDFTGYIHLFANVNFFMIRKFALLLKVYDLPRMKVQGWFQYMYILFHENGTMFKNDIYTVDTRNVFFQNISMFYNQKVNLTDDGLEPTGEDSGFWVETPCNRIQMATIMVDYHFFDTIHRMQSYGYEFGDRFQLRIHTPFYRKTIMSEYSLFRSQWNNSYPEPRVFIHPISKYKEHCDKYKNCSKFDYEKWSTDPEFTQYIRDVKCEIIRNEIRINFTELEEIYKADGFHRPKLVINVNNTMTPHITHYTNGLWAELVDLVTNDYVMKTKTIMDETEGYVDDYEADPFRNFYLTCEIPDNITGDDMEFYIKKFGILQTAFIWFRLDVFNQSIAKLYPARFNVVFKFPPEILVTNYTFLLTYKYYRKYDDIKAFWYWVLKDLREDGIGDGTITNATYDIKRNIVNVSELHSNQPNGDDDFFWTQKIDYLCNYGNGADICHPIAIRRLFLYYFQDLFALYSKNDTGPVDITVYYVRYVPYHSKNQINRGLHRWNQHHAGWNLPTEVLFSDYYFMDATYNFFFEAYDDLFFRRNGRYGEAFNVYGSTNYYSYSGPDCVFGMAGGSTLRNKSCEFWVGLIPDTPFTNYARDIVEEHVAYRTINDKTFVFNTSVITESYFNEMIVTCPAPGSYTSLVITIGYRIFKDLERSWVDGEFVCYEYYQNFRPIGCARYDKEVEYPLYVNLNQYMNEFFTKVELPEGIVVQDSYIGRVRPCVNESLFPDYHTVKVEYFLYDVKFFLKDNWCYYVNKSLFYSFNTIHQIGQKNAGNGNDIQIYANGFRVLENITNFEPNSARLSWGFYEDYFSSTTIPNEKQYHLLTFHKPVHGVVTSIERDNTQNDMLTTLNVTVTFSNALYPCNIVEFFLTNFRCMELVFQYYNGEPMEYYAYTDGMFYLTNIASSDDDYIDPHFDDTLWKRLGEKQKNKYASLFTAAYSVKQYKNFTNLVQDNKTFEFKIYLKGYNARSLKPTQADGYIVDYHYYCLFQTLNFSFVNTIPKYFSNLTVTPNSYFTSDRAIYKFVLPGELTEILVGDIFEFKTSWKTKYYNNSEAPDDEGYYINRFIVNYNQKKLFNITYKANFLLNPETLETQYIKDIRLYDEEGYLILVCNESVPIQMKKVAEFKRTEVHTEKTDDDNKFDISFEAVPEILIKKNDTLNIKFSSIVSLKDYPECKIESTKGLNIKSPDFKCEIDKESNELILYNAFKDIGENVSVFENMSAISLSQQEFAFILKDIPIYSNTNELENVYSIELRTETNGKATQKNLLPSTAIFKCDSRCKECNEQAPSECLLCSDNYPYYYPTEKYCHKFCPMEKYYQRKNENGINECLLCEEPCENCIGYATNCTLCSEGYFMENNQCVKNCNEGNERDYILRVCYPKVHKNKTVLVERPVYVNVSVPDPNIIIERNVCMINQN